VNQESGSTKLVMFAGIGLVALGGWLLFERILGPLVRPFYHLLHTMGALVWPLALIAIGVAILSRGRIQGGIAGMYRSRTDRIVGGVLGGIARRLGADAIFVRIAFVVFTVVTGIGTGIVLYVAAMILLPEEPYAAPVVTPAPPVPAPPGPASSAPSVP